METLLNQTISPQHAFVLEQTENSLKARTFAFVKKDSFTSRMVKISLKKTVSMIVGNKSIQIAQETKHMIQLEMNVCPLKNLVEMFVENTEVEES